MNHSELQRQIIQKCTISLVTAIIIWAIALLRGATVLRDMPGAHLTYEVITGPLHLHTITKQQTDNGFVVGFSFESGLLWYLILCLVAGLLAGWVRTQWPQR